MPDKTAPKMENANSSDWDLTSYDYHLPEEQIAQSPAQKRGGSNLYVLNRNGTDCMTAFSNLGQHLPEGALLVANNSMVVPARLQGQGTAGKRVEFLLLTPLPLLKVQHNGHCNSARAEGLLKGAKRFKSGDSVRFAETFTFTLDEKMPFGKVSGQLQWQGDLLEQLQHYGKPPLPPYIKRDVEEEDLSRYQTVYAKGTQPGSVAAPTAGLHFEQEHVQHLQQAGFQWAEVTLYVGYGTFSPIRCEDIRKHAMHAEYVTISPEAAACIAKAKSENRPVVAVGTTVARTLEGAALQTGGIAPFAGWVDLFIKPGFTFQAVDHLLTNFHLPRSSLLVLVSALAGRERVLQAYDRALASGFRFFSYGDAMFVL